MTNYLIIAGLAVLGVLVIGFVWASLYKRASKDIALIRTGAGGQKVVTDGGILVIPVLHELQEVDLTTTKIDVRRQETDSLITSDKIRVDVTGLFHIRVAPNAESIGRAAQTLGQRIGDKSAVRELLEGKLVSALRSAAAKMTMDDLHANRQDFINEVTTALKDELPTNGFELEGVAITTLNQTSTEFLDPKNAFDAVGLTAITKTIEDRKRERNDIEATNRVAIEKRNLEASKQSLAIAQEQEFAAQEQRQAVAKQTAETEAAIATQNAESKRLQEEARLASEQAVQQREIEKERSVKEAQIAQDRSVELARQEQNIAIQNKSKEESEAKAEADRARADAVTAAQEVITAEQTAKAERDKDIAVIAERAIAEQKAVGITVQAQAEKEAAANRADAIRIAAEGAAKAAVLAAQGDADAEKLRAEAARVTAEVEAGRIRATNEARNLQSEASMAYERALLLTEKMPSIIAESVKPMEKIDEIKIFSVTGLNGIGGNGDGTTVEGGTPGSGNLAQQVTNAALGYRLQTPLIDKLAGELFGAGNNGSTIEGLVNAASGAQATRPAPVQAPEAKVVEKAPAAPAPAQQPDQTGGRRQRTSTAS